MEINPADALKTVVRPRIHVTLEREGIPELRLKFTDDFTIGNDASCDIVLPDTDVSPQHAKVYFSKGSWRIKDLGSLTGTYLDGKQIKDAEITDECRVLFGIGGQILTFDIAELPHHVVTRQLREVFRTSGYVPVAMNRDVINRLIRRGLKLQSKRYVRIIGILVVFGAIAAWFGYQKQSELNKTRELAQSVFYRMKTFELTLTQLEEDLRDTVAVGRIQGQKAELQQLSDEYDKFIGQLGVYDGMDETDRLIYKTARVFGECELSMPSGFADEVKRYIGIWKASNRLPKAMERATAGKYPERISTALLDQQMPPQFFFLALQESEFDSTAVGPSTKYGIAKGMWQFIPSTAKQFGLRTGPLVAFSRMDPLDQRHNVDLASTAAAKYLRRIYRGEAQASGLLVLASYNCGDNAVRGLIRTLPENPRERNFWKFLETYRKRIPKETYDYVFLIFSAAVIGEDPSRFGFSFPKPLRDAAH